MSETIDPQKSQSVAVEKKEEGKNDLKEDIEAFVRYCQQIDVTDPVELSRVLQSYIVQGCELEPSEASDLIEGKTNFIYINKMDVLKSAIDEIKIIKDPRITLEVNLYGELAEDMGGPSDVRTIKRYLCHKLITYSCMQWLICLIILNTCFHVLLALIMLFC